MEIRNGFTRQGNARGNIEQYITTEAALDTIIAEYALREIERIEREENLEMGSSNSSKKYFSSQEFDEVSLPQNKQSIVQRALMWMKERRKTYQDSYRTSVEPNKDQKNLGQR